MITTVTQSDFTAAFHNIGRGNQFSHQGLLALYDYLTRLEDDLGEGMELDVIALCCEFVEYSNFEELKQEYDVSNIEELGEFTTVIPLPNNGIIIQAY